MSKARIREWGENSETEDRCLEDSKPDNKGYESESTEGATSVVSRAPLSNSFDQEGNQFEKTVN